MELDHALPIAEDFHSLQGEGRWAGTPMHFIRLAGCSVGQSVLAKAERMPEVAFPILKTGNSAWRCHTYDDRPFWCDTDFKHHHWDSFMHLLDTTWEKHICITGGEPLLHKDKLNVFVQDADDRGISVHVETSGTIEWLNPDVWVSVSPKQGALDYMLDFADEIKLLVDEHFDLAKVPQEVLSHRRVYIQPINDELQVSRANFDRCLEILRLKPEWHVSVQLHKLLGLQ